MTDSWENSGTKSSPNQSNILTAQSLSVPCLYFSFKANEHSVSHASREWKNDNCPMPMGSQRWDNQCEAGTASSITGSICPEYAAVHVPLLVPDATATTVPSWPSFENTNMNFELITWQPHHRTVYTAGQIGSWIFVLNNSWEKNTHEVIHQLNLPEYLRPFHLFSPTVYYFGLVQP